MKVARDFFLEFKAELAQLSDSELIDRFNGAVGIRAFGVARQGYLWAIREELQERKIDFSSIGDDTVMSFKHVVFLKDKKLFRLSELEKEEAQKMFLSYLFENHQAKMKFNPTMIEYDDDQITFEMEKHQGTSMIETKAIAKNY